MYDRPENDIQKIKREDRVLSQINNNIGKEVHDSVNIQTPVAPVYPVTPVNKTYTVITGDTLYSISRRFGLTIEELKEINNMADTNIKIGQKLIIAR
jgi:LysM repeat protein